jgi:magnesium transporter
VNEPTPQRKDDGRSANGDIQPVERPWFFAGLLPSGAIARESGETSASFRGVLDTVSIGWVDYVTSTDFNKEALATALHLGFSKELISTLVDEPHTSYHDLDSELGIKVPSIQVRAMDVEAPPLLILMRKNFIFTIHTVSVDRRFSRLRRYGEIILKKIPAYVPDTDRLAMLLARIIDHNNDRNFEHLRQIEEQGDHLNEIMMDPFTPRATLGPAIYRLKHALLTYLDALWNTVDVLHTLRYGDAELITDDPKLLDKLGALGEDVNRQIGLAEHMSEVLASGLEVLQSIYNNQLQNLNNRLALLMTYLTIIGTAVLVPNTLATILGNAVFDIGPKDLGWYLTLMIGSTVLATFLVYWWVRKRGWIPKKMD